MQIVEAKENLEKSKMRDRGGGCHKHMKKRHGHKMLEKLRCHHPNSLLLACCYCGSINKSKEKTKEEEAMLPITFALANLNIFQNSLPLSTTNMA